MRLPFMRTVATKFKTPAQLAHMSAKRIHDLQRRIKHSHREWDEIKHTLLRIRKSADAHPDGPHKKALAQVFKSTDAFLDLEKRYDKHMHNLKEHVKQIEEHVNAADRQKD